MTWGMCIPSGLYVYILALIAGISKYAAHLMSLPVHSTGSSCCSNVGSTSHDLINSTPNTALR